MSREQVKRGILIGVLLLVPLFLTSCEILDPFGVTDIFKGGSGEEQVDKFPLALGGVAEGWDEAFWASSADFSVINFETQQPQLLEFAIPPGFSSYEEARGAQLIPLAAGVADAEIWVDDSLRVNFTTYTAPQSLIQILVGEAHGQLQREAAISDGAVQLESQSLTGRSLAWVIRNRIALIDDMLEPALFAADAVHYFQDPPTSQYEAVIEAVNGDVYQFSPVDPNDPNHDIYLDSAQRVDLVSTTLRQSYDQAVLSAASVFAGLEPDPTGGAFAFYSPTQAEYTALLESLFSETTVLDPAVGTSDAQFPAFAPVQVFLLLEISSQSPDNDIPAFVFIRERSSSEPAVVAAP